MNEQESYEHYCLVHKKITHDKHLDDRQKYKKLLKLREEIKELSVESDEVLYEFMDLLDLINTDMGFISDFDENY